MYTMTLVIGNKKYSSWSMRPWVAMRHFDIPFTEHLLHLFTDTWVDDVGAFGSHTVPILVTDKMRVVDSLAILETLADQYPAMWPQNPILKAKAREACAMMHSGLIAMRSELHMNCSANKRVISISKACRRDLDKVADLWQSCMELTAQMEGINQGGNKGYLFGEFSIADAFFAPVAVRMQGYDVAIQLDTEQYVTHLLNNPAVAQWVLEGKAETIILPQEEVGETVNE